jgi:hypothetical protein
MPIKRLPMGSQLTPRQTTPKIPQATGIEAPPYQRRFRVIQILRNALSTLTLAGAISFALTTSTNAQGIRTNQGSFGSGWNVGGSSRSPSPYSGATGGANTPSIYGHSDMTDDGSRIGRPSGSIPHSGRYFEGSTSGNDASTSATDASNAAGSGSLQASPRSAGGGLRIQ